MTPAIPQVAARAPSSHEHLERDIAVLAAHKQAWAEAPIKKKIEYLRQLKESVAAVAERWVAAAAEAKGIAGTALAGEEWASGPWAVLFSLSHSIEVLSDIERHGAPRLPSGAVRTRADGQVIVDVFPLSLFDRLLLSGVRGEVWMQRDVTRENIAAHMASFYREKNPTGKVALVLGAGNIASIAPLDVLYKMITEGQVCLLKMNPVNEYLGPFLEEAFKPLIDDGFLRIAYGAADVGAFLTSHPAIEEIHITGSARTHDAIVFGTGEAGEARRREKRPQNEKRVTSELGNVSPTIVVPGPWTEADLRFQSENIATQKMHNGGFNCIASQVLVLPASWDKTPALLDAVRATLKAVPNRRAYYPGAAERQKAALADHPAAEILDEGKDGVPRTLVADVSCDKPGDSAFQVEAFGGVLSATRLPGDDAKAFLDKAVAFCNDTLWGTLGANIIIHPTTLKQLGPAFEDAIARLKYGCIGVNAWSGVGFLLSQMSWGAYPGHRVDDIQSGIGVVHNTFMFDKPEKSVVRASFYPFPRGLAHGSLAILPKPPWFITNKQADAVSRKLTAFERNHNPLRLPGIFFSALRG